MKRSTLHLGRWGDGFDFRAGDCHGNGSEVGLGQGELRCRILLCLLIALRLNA